MRKWGNLVLNQDAPDSTEKVLSFHYSREDFREDLQEQFGEDFQ